MQLKKALKGKIPIRPLMLLSFSAAVSFLLSATWTNTKAKAYDFYVDAASSAVGEEGTQSNPFRSINDALSKIYKENLKGKTVYVKSGEYHEAIVLKKNTKIVGESKETVIINSKNASFGVVFECSSDSSLRNVTVKNANVNILVKKRSRAQIDNVIVDGSASNGIKVEKTSRKNKYLFRISESSIINSGTRGLYVMKHKVEIRNNIISHNKEEGIDTHSGIRGKISGNTIEKNGESGIESVVSGVDISIKSNKIRKNSAQGISVQFYTKEKGKIKIIGNSIKDNDGAGIRYARYADFKKGEFQKFREKCIKESGNEISGNGGGDYSYH